MKVDNKTHQSCPGVDQEINFNDKAINKLSIKEGNRINFKFKDIKTYFLNGLILRYSPLTQKKLFYLKYKYKGKSQWIKLNQIFLFRRP